MGWNDMRRFFVTLCDAQRRTAPWPAKTEKEIENQRTLCFSKLYAVAVKVNNVRFLLRSFFIRFQLHHDVRTYLFAKAELQRFLPVVCDNMFVSTA